MAIIQDFTARCAKKNEQMAQVWKFDFKSELEVTITTLLVRIFSSNSDVEPSFQTCAIDSFFIAQWAVKSWIIAKPSVFSYRIKNK